MQRVNTGVFGSSTLGCEIDFCAPANDNRWVPLACAVQDSSQNYVVLVRGTVGGDNGLRFDYGSSKIVLSKYILSDGKRHIVRKEAERNYLDGSEVDSNDASTFDSKSVVALLYFSTVGAHSSLKLYSARFWDVSNGRGYRKYIPAVDSSGKPCMYDRVTKQPFYNNGTGQFIVGMTLEQARKLSKLPSAGGTLTVSLPWEAQLVQHNGQVETALETARGKGWLLKVQYRAPEAESAVYNKYAACTNTADVQAVNADYKTDLTADGEWVYPLPKFKTSTLAMFKNKQMKAFLVDLSLLEDAYFMLHETGLERYDGDLSSLIRGEGLFHNCFSFILFNGVLKVLKNGNHMFNSTKMTSFGADLSVLERGEYMFHMVPLTEFLSELPKLSMADFMFSRSMFDKDSTLRIFNSLPTWASGTHKITIGIHIDNQTDDEVLAAIANAEAKGWTLTVAWNGTPTAHAASTFGLRRPTIYAKSSNMELPDGTSERVLDWGHYVTNWEENGYLEFASVEEAEEYFGIEKEAER